MGADLLKADVGVVEVSTSISSQWSYFIVKEVTRRDRPLRNEWGAIREWRCTLTEAVPMLALVSSGSIIQMVIHTIVKLSSGILFQTRIHVV